MSFKTRGRRGRGPDNEETTYGLQHIEEPCGVLPSIGVQWRDNATKTTRRSAEARFEKSLRPPYSDIADVPRTAGTADRDSLTRLAQARSRFVSRERSKRLGNALHLQTVARLTTLQPRCM